MTFPSSGSISASTINAEIGQASNATLSMNSSAYRNRVLNFTDSSTISFADAYEFVLTLNSPPSTVREPSSGSNYTQGSTDWEGSTYYNYDQVRWGGSLLAQIGYNSTSWSSGSTTYYRDSLVTSGAEGYGIRYYYRIYRTVLSVNGFTNPDVRQLAVNAGWDQNMRLVVNVASNTVVSSNTTASPAMAFTGSFPKGAILINNGKIIGMGGRGGAPVQPGLPGGHAITNSTTLRIYNNGIIAGGGGGGGAGVSWGWNGLERSCAGSAGASGATQVPGTANNYGFASSNGSADTNADLVYETGGASYVWGYGGRVSSPGGKGGNWGQAGDAGGTVDGNYSQTGYAGGAAGKAVSNSGSLTWGATGTTYGATS